MNHVETQGNVDYMQYVLTWVLRDLKRDPKETHKFDILWDQETNSLELKVLPVNG